MRWTLKTLSVAGFGLLMTFFCLTLVTFSFHQNPSGMAQGQWDSASNKPPWCVWRQGSAENPQKQSDSRPVDYEMETGAKVDSMPKGVPPDHQVIGEISCQINGGKQALKCLRDSSNEVFIPFQSFLAKYFEIFGSVVREADGEEHFEWWHSGAKIVEPTGTYDPRGVYGQFSSYNVESRDRVKCIGGRDGVPMSIQWGPTPYHYPIQIAQFALEHYSKNITEPEPIIEQIDGGEKYSNARKLWKFPPEYAAKSLVEYIDEPSGTKSRLIHMDTDESLDNPGVFAQLGGDRKLLVLEFQVKFVSPNASFTLILERLDTNAFYHVHYVQTSELVSAQKETEGSSGGTILYGIGQWSLEESTRWRRITRNLATDLTKGIASMGIGNSRKRFRLPLGSVQVVSLSFRGEVMLDNITLGSASHISQFLDGADWLLHNQDINGGWPIPVERNLAERRLNLQPGWYSAMAQGHAMSALCRAYQLTGDGDYLKAAVRATGLFDVPAAKHGILNHFMGLLPWYEEYPTTPATFVLNGFIYSLVGLYDLKMTLGHGDDFDVAQRLYTAGVESLEKLLPLFDTGSGSAYDLRHVTLKIEPNVARWDYHSVHIYQLLWLEGMEKRPVFRETAERWIRYAKGERAKHN